MTAKTFVYHVDVGKDNACFEGHFPTFPVFPAVAQLALLQQAIAAYHQQDCELTALPMVKFLQPIVPDTQLVIELEMKEHGCMNFLITSEEETFAKGRLHYSVKYHG
ncbi:MAG: hypothetical protein COB41_08985 [Proteobacteria bacterium]|nr:MAG: hypothetical protein COB41_08985 [Pseudomonadota bacterium]